MTHTTIRWPQYVAGLAAAGGGLAIGSGLGWSAPAGPRLIEQEQYFPITQSQFDWVASIMNLGAAVSCLPIGYLMKKFGRKWTMLSLVVPFMVGWALVIWAQNFTMLMIGRFTIGLAGGAFCVSAPQYSAEIAEKEIRGTIGSFFQLLVITGVLFVYLVGPFMRLFSTNLVCAMIPILFAAIFFFMPESPVYLVIEKREEEAVKSYKWLRGSSFDPQAEVDELKQELLDSQSTKVSLKEEFGKRSSILGIIISVGLMFFQQMSGINVVIFYATIIFDVRKFYLDSTGAFNWSLAFLITATFTSISKGIGIGPTFWIFSGLSVLGTLFVFFVVPETKGKSMTEIQRMMSSKKAIK